MTWAAASSASAGPMAGRPTFTCASCHAIFENGDMQRSHYQSDWHRYNLRRKVADLPPVTEAIFSTKVKALNEGTSQRVADMIPKSYSCDGCRKSFCSENAFESHQRSKKHLEKGTADSSMTVRELKLKTQAPPSDNAFLSAEATEAQIHEAVNAKLASARRLKSEDCIFCNQTHSDFDANMEHMTKHHGLYIPDLEFVEDLPGLIGYLADKVGVAFCCLYCPSGVNPFTSLESVRRHMVDKGHLKVRFDDEGMQELAEFYNYEEIVSDDDDEDFVDITDEDEELEGQGDALLISPDETELILPSGKRIGNRAYRLYYKQYLRTTEAPARQSRRGEHQALISRMSDHYVAAGMVDPAAHRHLERAQRHQHNDRSEWDARIGIRTNGLQEHFRHQLRQ